MSWEPTKLRMWHEALMDWLILNPGATSGAAALAFDMHEITISCVIRSDLFQARLRERRDRMEGAVESMALARLTGKVAVLASESVDALTERVQLERKALGLGGMGVGEIRETADMALKALGFSPQARQAPAPTVTNVFVIDRDTLAAARNKMRSVNGGGVSHETGLTLEQPAPILATA